MLIFSPIGWILHVATALPTASTLPAWHALIEQYTCVMSGHTGQTKLAGNDPAVNSGPRSERKQTYLHPVGEPIAFRVCALHCEQNIAPRNDTSLWHCLDFNRQVSIIFLQKHTDTHKYGHSESDSHCGRYFLWLFFEMTRKGRWKAATHIWRQ